MRRRPLARTVRWWDSIWPFALLGAAVGGVLDEWRDPETDVALGIRQLVDIAVRALSLGTNDPYTAVVAIDSLAEILIDLAHRQLEPRTVRDASGRARVMLRSPSLADYLFLAVDEISRYGAAEPRVESKLVLMATEVGMAARSTRDTTRASQLVDRILGSAEARMAPMDLEDLRSAVRHAKAQLDGGPTPAVQWPLSL